ncbi:UDP-N-acetylmuramate:L-alanyl-gamma-D-glutamyl-meso-diaminopimelate ligase [Magnetofaba australis]|uniref:Putative UDP-N-acetylmuramate:L-alanyl-gamma-D-glutamyl-meso-diaminopimelate ligase n=1 Tax=Magnetofaba australis IT-1 TaxID=1434232 RepID=A0A1Y2K8Z3_9PROT|nr:UDP-N-acetylmuramate:L-alanyl-gamma-D-glutamyl-meso-diaminopimelate ligase [Magnetofaba australis]OSM07220.1 putative UDP-N-acetylmuramate:L-alanyl-gamma-D-glutamyl-meso-diaminopimelate ligase [Magnetofaba australis IT-1]
MKHLHVIGICGTAMAGLAALAQDGGWRVTGSDAGIYPPMSDFLAKRGIPVREGFDAAALNPTPDLVLVGNAISRGNAELEAVLDAGLPYVSGAQWLYENVLAKRHPVVIAGTHGKTTTSSMTAALFRSVGWKPGFLIGGIPLDFGHGAQYPGGQFVVVEGDEYDTAFFDKRPKFLHYRPRTLILNNLEFDHADIYPDLEAIRVQFRYLLRSVPRRGVILANGDDAEIEDLVANHAYGPVTRFGIDGDYPFRARLESPDGSSWTLLRNGAPLFTVEWAHLGRHNVSNGLAAAAAALIHGAAPDAVKKGLAAFQGVARRLQVRANAGGITLYDDFAHHPTAIATTLAGLRAKVGENGRIWAVLEPRSNTMRRRVHQAHLAESLVDADGVIIAQPAARGLAADDMLDVAALLRQLQQDGRVRQAHGVDDADGALEILRAQMAPGDHIVIMSNGGFGGIHARLAEAIEARV